jgi:hypothetical protein
MEIDSENAPSENSNCSKPRKIKRCPDSARKKNYKSLRKIFTSEDHLSDDTNSPKFRKNHRRLFFVDGISTPHNTTQYLTANHCRGISDYPINISYSMFTDEEFKKLISNDSLSVDDLCVSGGSMKGVIAASMCRSDVCTRQINGLIDIINSQRTVIENLKQQIQNVQRT